MTLAPVMTLEQAARVEEIRARYPGQRIAPGEVVMAEEPVRHPGIQHCGSCQSEEEMGYGGYLDDLCCCRDSR